MSDSLRRLEHSHTHLARSMLALHRIVDGDMYDESLIAHLERFRDELLDHFANEEEVLFPFVRERDANLASEVDALVEAHDVLCARIVRLAHAVKHGSRKGGARMAYANFQTLYAKHSCDEAALLDKLAERLTASERRVLDAKWQRLEPS